MVVYDYEQACRLIMMIKTADRAQGLWVTLLLLLATLLISLYGLCTCKYLLISKCFMLQNYRFGYLALSAVKR